MLAVADSRQQACSTRRGAAMWCRATRSTRCSPSMVSGSSVAGISPPATASAVGAPRSRPRFWPRSCCLPTAAAYPTGRRSRRCASICAGRSRSRSRSTTRASTRRRWSSSAPACSCTARVGRRSHGFARVRRNLHFQRLRVGRANGSEAERTPRAAIAAIVIAATFRVDGRSRVSEGRGRVCNRQVRGKILSQREAVTETTTSHADKGVSARRATACFDNPVAESFFATVEKDLLRRRSFATRQEAKTAVFDYIETFLQPDQAPLDARHRSPVEYEIIFGQEVREAA
jgi:hypothetical protein